MEMWNIQTHFVVWGQCTSADGPSPHRPQCMQISIQSSPGCFQYNTSASGPVLIPLYPQPMHCFIQSNALSAMSTWTSGHITEPKKKCACVLGKRVCLWRVRRQDKGDKVHAVELKYLAVILTLPSVDQRSRQWSIWGGFFAPPTPGETGASVAFFIVS